MCQSCPKDGAAFLSGKKSPRESVAVLGVLLFLYCIASAWALCHIFSGRGAYIHFGAMLGTIMVLNVYFVIIPGQREMVKAKEEGRPLDPKVREFMRFVLSREGQEVMARVGYYYPLDAAYLQEQLKKLD